MDVHKSSRHTKIIGSFGENIICNLLSRSGFETVLVDHTGLDVIASDPSTNQRIGITIKSRTRNIGTERTAVNIFRNKREDRTKLLKACEAFSCKPWIGIYVETANFADVYLTSLDNYDSKYCGREKRTVDTWKMREKDVRLYSEDPLVKHIRINFDAANWYWQ